MPLWPLPRPQRPHQPHPAPPRHQLPLQHIPLLPALALIRLPRHPGQAQRQVQSQVQTQVQVQFRFMPTRSSLYMVFTVTRPMADSTFAIVGEIRMGEIRMLILTHIIVENHGLFDAKTSANQIE